MKVRLEQVDAQVAKIILNRPERKNAIDFEVIKQLDMYLDQLHTQKNLTVLWIQGEGGSFCSGGDLDAFHSLKSTTEAMVMLSAMSNVLKKIVTLPAITVSYITGPAIGGGAEIASATDFTLANDKAKIGFVQGKLGITTGWGGATLLKRKLGYHKALTFVSTAKIYEAEELRNLGFIDKWVSDEKEVYHWCQSLLLTGDVVQAYKQFLFSEEEKSSIFTSMDEEVTACATLWGSEAHHQAVEAFRSKRG